MAVVVLDFAIVGPQQLAFSHLFGRKIDGEIDANSSPFSKSRRRGTCRTYPPQATLLPGERHEAAQSKLVEPALLELEVEDVRKLAREERHAEAGDGVELRL